MGRIERQIPFATDALERDAARWQLPVNGVRQFSRHAIYRCTTLGPAPVTVVEAGDLDGPAWVPVTNIKIYRDPEQQVVYRDAKSGNFVTREYAEAHPDTTVKETNK